MKLRLTIGALILALVAVASAQETEKAPEPALVEEKAPAHLGSEAAGATLETDTELGNTLAIGATVGAAYDDRGLYHSGTTPTRYTSDTRFFVQPSIALRRKYNLGDWTLSYTPGLSIDQHNTNDTQYTHNLAGDGTIMLSPHVQLHGRQDFSVTDNPFETVGRVDLLPGLGGAFGPNYEGVLPQTKRTAVVSNADISFRLSEHSALGFTGGYQSFDYDPLKINGTVYYAFVNSRVYNASAFYSRQFSERLTAGLQAAWVDVYSTGSQTSRTQAPVAMAFVKYSVNPHLSFSFYGGPQYARTRDVVTIYTTVYQHKIYPNLGGTAVWSNGRHAVELEASRRIANGGGLLDAVKEIHATAGYRARLSQKLLGTVRVDFTDQEGFGALSNNSKFRSTWVGGGPTYELSRSFSVRGEVAYVHQTSQNITTGAGNHLLAQISLDYRFHKKLGD